MATLTLPGQAKVGTVVNVTGTSFPNRKTRLLLDGVGATTNIFRPDKNGWFQVGITVSSTPKTQTLIAQQDQGGGAWAEVARTTIQVVGILDQLALPAAKTGWTPVLTELFDKPCAEGQFSATYPQFTPYSQGWQDTSHKGRYNPNIASVADGVMSIRVRTENGYPQVFAMTAKPPGFSALGGASRWRVESIIRSDRLPGYKAVPMGWTDERSKDHLVNGVDMGPDYVKWLYGEWDYIEGNLDGSLMKAFMHYSNVKISVDSSTKKITVLENPYQEYVDLGINLDNWHHVAAEYDSGNYCEVFIDGSSKRRFTTRVPIGPFHLNWQFETNLSGQVIDPATTGKIQIAAIRVSVPA